MLKRIPMTELRLGMYVHELCDLQAQQHFLSKSFLLRHEGDLQRIRETGVGWLSIDLSRSVLLAPEQTAHPRPQVPQGPVPLSEEVQSALALCRRAKAVVTRLITDVRMGRIAEVAEIRDLVAEVSDSLSRHPDALLGMARLKGADEYTYLHSLAVCALMIGLARQLALPDKLVREAGMAGLLLDIGKLDIPNAILSKTGTLSEEELAVIRSHPANGARLLGLNNQFSERILDVCLHHHERYDGSGYPDKLAGSQISLFARMAAICDEYDAMTSERPHQPGQGPAESIGRMAGWVGAFDEKVFHAFVKCVGIYPVGSLVRLQSGNLGVVVEQNPTSLLTPKVRVFFSAQRKVPIEQRLIDLSMADEQERIVGRECARHWGFKHLDALWTGLPEHQSSRSG